MQTIAIDFDGVIHRYSQGWHDGTIYDVAMEGAFDSLKNLMRHYTVFVLSTRKPIQIIEWFSLMAPDIETSVIPDNHKFWNVKGVIGITDRKLPALFYLDDRAVRFTNWNTAYNMLLTAVPIPAPCNSTI